MAAVFPSEDDVQLGVQYGPVTGIEFTGNLVLPTEAQVEDGIGFGASGTEFTGTLGASCDYPLEEDVEDGVVYGNTTKTGEFAVPDESTVETSVQFGGAGGTEFTGTLSVVNSDVTQRGWGWGD